MGFLGIGKKPGKNTPIVSEEEVHQRLLALNRETAPYQILDGRSQNVDLVAEWKIVDARWYEVFAKASLTKVFRIYMKFDEAKHDVRAKDEEFTVEWRAGVPSISLSASKFQGQKTSTGFAQPMPLPKSSNQGKSIHIDSARMRSRNLSRKLSLPAGGAIKAWPLASYKERPLNRETFCSSFSLVIMKSNKMTLSYR